jgi:hypothetical protein
MGGASFAIPAAGADLSPIEGSGNMAMVIDAGYFFRAPVAKSVIPRSMNRKLVTPQALRLDDAVMSPVT